MSSTISACAAARGQRSLRGLDDRDAVLSDTASAARSQLWFDAIRPGRWVHLVVGGEGWRRHLAEEPLAVSWADPDDLPDAVRCAFELGLVLGFGPMPGGTGRARPLDVALAVRDLLPELRGSS